MASDTSSLSAQVNKLNLENDNDDDTGPGELVAVVDDLLDQLGSKFSNLTSELIAKMDEMTKRLDSLEAAIRAGNTSTSTES